MSASIKALNVEINNNGYMVVPYNATPAELNDPTNSAYKVYTGIYNTDCVNCSPEGNRIRSDIAFQSQAFYTYNNQKLQTSEELKSGEAHVLRNLSQQYMSHPINFPISSP